jgi:hypothetical protein
MTLVQEHESCSSAEWLRRTLMNIKNKRTLKEAVSNKATNESKTAVIEVRAFICVSLGSRKSSFMTV